MSSLPQLRLRDGYREQLISRGAYRVANQQSLACLSGSERRRPGWFLDFLDMKYQTCSSSLCMHIVLYEHKLNRMRINSTKAQTEMVFEL